MRKLIFVLYIDNFPAEKHLFAVRRADIESQSAFEKLAKKFDSNFCSWRFCVSLDSLDFNFWQVYSSQRTTEELFRTANWQLTIAWEGQEACIENNIRLIVSGGAGMKNDPTKLQIRDISDVKYDNLIMRLKR